MKQTEAGTGLFFILFPLPFALCAPRRTLPKFSQSSRKRFACKLFSWRVEPAYSCLYHGVRTSCRSDSISQFWKGGKKK